MGHLLGASPEENPAPLIKDKHAITITDESERTVGHVRKIVYFYLRREWARRRYSSDLEQGGSVYFLFSL